MGVQDRRRLERDTHDRINDDERMALLDGVGEAYCVRRGNARLEDPVLKCLV
jgi:hypothetical protein